MNTKKGTYGYLTRERRKYIVITVLLFAAVFVIFFTARILLGTNQNIFSIIAALLCLPAARMAVNLVMLVKAKGCSPEAYEKIRKAEDPACCRYDLYLTTYQQNFDLAHVCVFGKSVIALTLAPGVTDALCRAGENHIRTSMQKSGFHGYGVHIFSSEQAYLARMAQLYAAGEGEEEKKQTPGILALLLQLAL